MVKHRSKGKYYQSVIVVHCCLGKMAPDLPRTISKGLTPMMGVEIKFDSDLCTGCGKCVWGSCFVNAIRIEDGKAIINDNKCRVCGRCAEICGKSLQ